MADGDEDGHRPRFEGRTLEQMADFLRRQDLAHLAFTSERPGAVAFITCCEWYWYTPDTPRNRFFHLNVMTWEAMVWAVASFPAARLPAARKLASQLGMRLADGVPTLLIAARAASVTVSARPSRAAELRAAGMEPRFFPGAALADGRDNRAAWHIENDRGSPVYLNRRRLDEEVKAAEGEIQEVFKRGHRPTPREVADYVWGDAAPHLRAGSEG